MYLSLDLTICLSVFWQAVESTARATKMMAQRTRVVRARCAFRALTSKFASHHNGVHFLHISRSDSAPNLTPLRIWEIKCASRHNSMQLFVSHPTKWLRTRRFSKPTFRPSRATKHWKDMENIMCCGFSTFFAHLDLLSTDSFLFSDCSHHCCCICP